MLAQKKSGMVRESKRGPMGPVMKESGSITKQTAEAYFGTFMEISMKVNGSTTKHRVTVFTHMLMVQNTKENGKTICRTVGA